MPSASSNQLLTLSCLFISSLLCLYLAPFVKQNSNISYKTHLFSSFLVKCIKDTPAYFAERLHKAMQVRLLYHFIVIITNQMFPALRGGSRSRGEDFTAAVNEVSHCDVLTGSRDQGHNPHPHHGVPLRDRYAGHQTGLCEDLRKITVHSHLSKSH